MNFCFQNVYSSNHSYKKKSKKYSPSSIEIERNRAFDEAKSKNILIESHGIPNRSTQNGDMIQWEQGQWIKALDFFNLHGYLSHSFSFVLCFLSLFLCAGCFTLLGSAMFYKQERPENILDLIQIYSRLPFWFRDRGTFLADSRDPIGQIQWCRNPQIVIDGTGERRRGSILF